MNLIFSENSNRDKELKAAGHRFLGAGYGGMTGRKEIHVFLKKGSKLRVEFFSKENLEKLKQGLMNAKGAYKALAMAGAHEHLPGYEGCVERLQEGLKAFDELEGIMGFCNSWEDPDGTGG